MLNNVINNFATTLAKDCTSADTTITLTDVTGLPSAGVLTFADNNEIVHYTAINGNDLTVERGYDGTTASAHSAGCTVEMRYIAEHYNGLKNEIINHETNTNNPHQVKLEQDSSPKLGGDLDMNGHLIGGNSEADLSDAVANAIPWNDEGLVLYLPFDENTGTTAYDKSHYGNNGTLENGVAWSEGHKNTALSFDGVDDYVDCGAGASLDITDKITIEVWAKFITLPTSGFPMLVSKKNAYNLGYYSSADKWYFEIYSGGTNYKALSNTVVTGNYETGKWYHFAGVMDGSQNTLFIDAAEQGHANPSGIDSQADNHVNIGRYEGNYYMNAIIDEVRIYNRALSAEEIKMHYLRG